MFQIENTSISNAKEKTGLNSSVILDRTGNESVLNENIKVSKNNSPVGNASKYVKSNNFECEKKIQKTVTGCVDNLLLTTTRQINNPDIISEKTGVAARQCLKTVDFLIGKSFQHVLLWSNDAITAPTTVKLNFTFSCVSIIRIYAL